MAAVFVIMFYSNFFVAYLYLTAAPLPQTPVRSQAVRLKFFFGVCVCVCK